MSSVISIEDDDLSTRPSDTLSIVDPVRFTDQPQFFDTISTPPPSSPTICTSQEDIQVRTPTPLNIEGPHVEPHPKALNTRRRRSWIWKHRHDGDSNTIHLDHRGKVQWRCHYCNKNYLESGGTRIIAVNLRVYHSIGRHPLVKSAESVQKLLFGKLSKTLVNPLDSNVAE